MKDGKMAPMHFLLELQFQWFNWFLFLVLYILIDFALDILFDICITGNDVLKENKIIIKAVVIIILTVVLINNYLYYKGKIRYLKSVYKNSSLNKNLKMWHIILFLILILIFPFCLRAVIL